MIPSPGTIDTAAGLAGFVQLARGARSGDAITLGVVVEAPATPELVGRRVAWDGIRLRGTFGDRGLDRAAADELAEATGQPGCREIADGVILYVERIEPPPELVVVGAGHIAQPLAAAGALLGWRVTVLDDRPEFATTERFPSAGRVVVCDFDDPFAGIAVGPSTRIVLVTRGHRYDYDCLLRLARAGAEPAYIGMIGSRRRVRAAFEQLAAEGIGAAWLARIRAPIGLDIEAETPAEIAVAVAAEMIQAVRGGTGRPLRDETDVVRYVRGLRESGGSEDGP